MTTKELIERAVSNFIEEIPALKQLKLQAQLELKAKGDVQTWSVELPNLTVGKEIPDHAMLILNIQRPVFNELAEKGTLKQWHTAFDHGDVKASGQDTIIKLLGNVIERHEARSQLKKIKR